MSRWNKVLGGLKNFMEKVTHEVPTGPHTDVRRRKINPSLKAPSLSRKVPDAKGGFRAAKRRPTK
tara:strand:+ start:656 stop:850 length:195 start_codon:yes stop_codon:yes gene_type:complete